MVPIPSDRIMTKKKTDHKGAGGIVVTAYLSGRLGGQFVSLSTW